MAKAKTKAGTKAAGMFPTAGGADDGEQEATAKALLERLGLCEELRKDEAEPEGDVESEESEPEE